MKGWAETTIRTLFAFNGFVVLLAIQCLLMTRVPSISWLHGVLGTAAWASLLWVLYRESQLPAKPVPTAGHVVWVLSALVYIWLCEDPALTFVDHVGWDFSNPPDFKKIVQFQLMRISIYVLLSTTGLAWLLRVIAGRRPDASQAQSYSRMSGLLLGSICAMLALILFALSGTLGVRPYLLSPA